MDAGLGVGGGVGMTHEKPSGSPRSDEPIRFGEDDRLALRLDQRGHLNRNLRFQNNL